MKKMKKIEIQGKPGIHPSAQGSFIREGGEKEKLIHISKIRGAHNKTRDLAPSYSFGREKSYKTMGSLKTAASDNSFMHKNLNSLGSYISHRSTNSL